MDLMSPQWTCPFDVDSYRVYFLSHVDKISSYTVEQDISRTMVDKTDQIERARLLDDITELGESTKLFESWQVDPIKDLWFHFKKIAHKSEHSQPIANNRFRWKDIATSLQASVNKEDFYRFIYGQKVTNSNYYVELYRHFAWTIIEPNFEIKQELQIKSGKFEQQKEYIRGAAVLLFHYHLPGAIKMLEMVLNPENKHQLQGKKEEEVTSVLRFLKSFEEIHSKVLKKPELTERILRSDFEQLKFSANLTPEQQEITAEAIEIKGMMKMMAQQASSLQYSDQYLNLMRAFICKDIDAKTILLCQDISITDRIPFLIRFAPEKLLEAIEECVKEAVQKGYLEFIILLEDEEQIVQLVQSYLDQSSDIQTTAVVGLKLISMRLVTKPELVDRISKWYKNYQGFLNKNQLYLKRAKTDEKKIEIFRVALSISKEEQTRNSELFLYCGNCKNPFSLAQYLKVKKQGKDIKTLNKESSLSSKQFVSNCISCSKATPQCAICFLPLNFTNPVQRLMEKLKMNTSTSQSEGTKGNEVSEGDLKFVTYDQ